MDILKKFPNPLSNKYCFIFHLKEAQGFLGDTPIGETRSQTQQMVKTTEEEEDDEEEEEDEDDDGVEDDLVDEVGNGDEEDDDVPNLKRTHTMAETLEVSSLLI